MNTALEYIMEIRKSLNELDSKLLDIEERISRSEERSKDETLDEISQSIKRLAEAISEIELDRRQEEKLVDKSILNKL